MSTITRLEPEPFPGEGRGPGAEGFCQGSPASRRLAQTALALAGWAAIMLAMPFLGPSGRQVAVVGDPSAAVRAIARAGGQIVEIRGGAVIARANPAALYRAGAWLVVEGRLAGGCAGGKAGA
jgi:hypothetical protein